MLVQEKRKRKKKSSVLASFFFFFFFEKHPVFLRLSSRDALPTDLCLSSCPSFGEGAAAATTTTKQPVLRARTSGLPEGIEKRLAPDFRSEVFVLLAGDETDPNRMKNSWLQQEKGGRKWTFWQEGTPASESVPRILIVSFGKAPENP